MKNFIIILTICLVSLNQAIAIEDDDFGVIPSEEVLVQDDENIIDDEIINEQADNVNDVYLNVNNENKYKNQTQNTKQNYDVKNLETGNNDAVTNFDPNSAYQKKSTSYKKEKKFKNVDLGAKYDTTFTPDTATQTRTLYSNYHFKDNMSINTSYKSNSFQTASQQAKGTFSISPEYRFNKHFAIQNTFSSNLSNKSQKGEISLKLNPLKDVERMDLNFGAGQVQYNSGAPSSSQINFGSNFRF